MAFNEADLVEIPFVEKLVAKGWKLVRADELERESFEEPLLTPQLARSLKRINGWMTDEDVRQVINELKLLGFGIEHAKKMLRYIKEGIYLKSEKARELRRALLFDYDRVENNEFVVSRQVIYRRGEKEIRTDIMLYVNGIPLVNAECKNPASFSVSWLDSYNDVKNYEKAVPELYKYVQIGVGIEKEARYFPIVPWQEQVKASLWRNENLDSLESTAEMLAPSVLLDILRHYLFYRMESGNATKVISRHMQYRAAEKIVARVKDSLQKKDGKNRGLIWHWQGSGKSLCMIFAANKLYYDAKLENPTIFFVVDRVELEMQLHDEISALDMPVAEKVDSVAHLRSILKHDGGKGRRGLFIVLMHKFKAGEFEELKKELEGREGESILTRRNIVAFIDEGHRTQYGLYAAQMKDLLRNAFFFAFTGTPISIKEKDTYQKFSYPPNEMYLDKYFITDSLQDGYTVKIVYQPRLEKEVHLDKKTLDAFLEIESDEIPGEERDWLEEEVKRKMSIIPLVFENPAFIAKIAADVAAHYKENVDGKFKAMVVAGSRKACVLYKRELDKHLPKEYSEVMITLAGKGERHKELREYASEMEERYGFLDIDAINSENKRKFKEEKYPNILIVTDMLLTGFDVPILQVMYLHKPLKGHRLLQAIARTNRPYMGVKEAGIIIDYVGILNDIKKALNVYSRDIDFKEPAESIEEQRVEFYRLVDEALAIFTGIPKNKYDRMTMDSAIRLLTTVRGSSESFIEKYKSLRGLFELLGSDVSKIKRFEDYCWLSAIYAYYTKAVLLEEPEAEQHLEKFYAKTLKLVYKTTQVQNLLNDLPIIKFDKDYLEALEKKMKTKQQKAASIVFTLNRLVLVERHANPVSESLSGKVARILKLWQDKAANFEAIYREGVQVIVEFNELNRRKDELGFDNLQYSLLLALEEKFNKQDKTLVEDVKELSNRLQDIMFPGWNFQQSAKKAVDREVRLFLRKYISQHGLNFAELEELHQKMMQLVVSYAKS